ncbi:MAG: hypothetical protein SF066_12630 [Thermoanaerobaculia bacterium]|nr:hypothetical protein [Thermoanaerobaculia bacterium]
MGREDDQIEAWAAGLLDEVVPEEFEWERVVINHPIASVLAVALGGYLLGRSRGSMILGSLGGLLADSLTDRVSNLVEGPGRGQRVYEDPLDDEFESLSDEV